MINIQSINETPLQNAVKEHGSQRSAAKFLGIPESTFRGWLEKEKNGERINSNVKGTSTLYDASGNVKLTWVKEDKNKADPEQQMLGLLEGLKSEIPKLKAKKSPKFTDKDLLTSYVLSDYHLGQLSWAEETGADWNVEIAKDLLLKWFERSVKEAPDSNTGILCNLGDFLHWDGFEAVTPSSGHVLDADTRFFRLAFVAGEVIKECINIMLAKHENVHIIMAEGNHDMASSVWLKVLLAMAYEDEPRVTIDKTPLPYYCYEWGSTSLFYHHGHKKRMSEISKTFAGMYREVFGRTKYSYCHMGHLHHEKEEEDQLMKVTQHPTLAAKDAFAARGGYISQRGAHVITYHKLYGEVKRSTSRPEMVQ